VIGLVLTFWIIVSFRQLSLFSEEGIMQLSNVAAWALVLLVGLLGGSSVLLHPARAQATGETKTSAIERPGDAKYTPTALEWATLELQAYYSQNWTSEDRVGTSFSQLNDGRTVLCLLQPTPDVSAETLKTERDVKQFEFDRYTKSRGWSWLRLQFQEKVLPRPSN
jgi:hypothetical protein